MNTNTLRITVAACCMAGSLQANAVVISAAGVDVASITGSRDAFRVTLGGGTTAGANGSFGGVRREINWDGVAAGFSAPNNLPANFFNSNSPRGVVFSTPGTGFAVSGATTDAGVGQPAAANFGNINASYTSTFLPFTAQRLFTPLGSNIMDVNFFVAGTGTAATVGGFGAIFSDVDFSNTTSIQYFDAGNTSLGTFFTPGLFGSQTFSFLGVSFNAGERIGRVRITTGNTTLGAGVTDNGDNIDVVVMDDFLFSEPTAGGVPEPGTVVSMLSGLGVLAFGFRRSRKS